MIMRENLIAIAIVFYSFIAYAGTIDPSVPDQKYKEYGSKFECVVEISGICCCDSKKDKHKFHASAVVIDPHWIVTAAHVVKDTSDVVIKVKDKEYKISKLIVHEDFEEGQVGYHDIALGYSEEDFGLSFYPALYDKKDEVSKVVSLCGYGMTGNFSTGAVKSDGAKRAGSNIVERTERSVLVCSIDGGKKTSLEFMIGSGDSGGGLFLDGKLAGINSFVMAADGKTNSDYGDECAHTRISTYKKWIEEKTK